MHKNLKENCQYSYEANGPTLCWCQKVRLQLKCRNYLLLNSCSERAQGILLIGQGLPTSWGIILFESELTYLRCVDQ